MICPFRFRLHFLILAAGLWTLARLGPSPTLNPISAPHFRNIFTVNRIPRYEVKRRCGESGFYRPKVFLEFHSAEMGWATSDRMKEFCGERSNDRPVERRESIHPARQKSAQRGGSLWFACETLREERLRTDVIHM